MKAFLIDPQQQTIDPVDVTNIDDIKQLIRFDTVIRDEIGPDGDRLYFDEECFLRGTEGRFQIDSIVPVAGKGVVVGGKEGDVLQDVVTDAAALKGRLKYL
ncbi:MAG: hypothetical protein KDI82_06375 [Gammaproteobacteria bacterium]|nr:hypothetical protein [Gammaproteobacteria bacterium]